MMSIVKLHKRYREINEIWREKEMEQNAVGVSVIIPVYNAEKYLEKCLDSLVNQSYQNFEVIFVNDGSTDKSLQMLQEFIKRDPEKFRVFSKKNGGQSSARNLALSHIRGEYTTFLDSDDYYDDDYLEILYIAAKKNDSDMVVSGQKKVDEFGKVYMNIDYPVDKYPDTVMRRLNFAGKLYRTTYMQKHNMKFAVGKTYEDNPFNLIMIFLAKNLVILPYSGYYQVGHPGSTTTKKIQEEKLPYKEIEDSISYIVCHRDEINNFAIFEFTVLSFFTYFIFQANKKHMYLNFKDRKSDIEVIMHLCTFVQGILDRYFPKYWKNKYIGIFKNYELPLSQRCGVWLFIKLCKIHLLKLFASIYYRF